jgi:hypothetical protein
MKVVGEKEPGGTPRRSDERGAGPAASNARARG